MLTAGSRIDVSGKAGGGTVALGTTLARANGASTGTAAAISKTLTVQKGATITANATAKGHGGRVVLLSKDTTTFAGTIAAKGGPLGGDGGFTEVSSGGMAPMTGQVDTTAPKGMTGTLLLDPTDIWISDTQPTLAGITWYSPATLAGEATNIALSAAGSLNVASSFGTSNTLALGSYSLTLGAGSGLTVDRGFVVRASAIQLTASGGPITLNGASGVAGGLITAQQLAALPATSLQLTAANSIAMSAADGIALGAAQLGTAMKPLAKVSLSTAAGGVTQDAAGAIFAATLQSGGVTGAARLISTSNQIATLSSFPVTGGDFVLVDNASLTVAGAVSASNVFIEVIKPFSLTIRANASLTAGIAADDRTTIVANTLNVQPGGKITGPTVEISPQSIDQAVSLLPVVAPKNSLILNQAALSSISATTLRIGAYTDATVNAVTIGTPISGSMTIASPVNLGGIASVLDVETLGVLGGPGSLAVTTLTGNLGTLALTNAGNNIANLGHLHAVANLTLDDGAHALKIAGAVSTSGQMTLTAGSITQSAAGIVTARELTGSAAGVDLSTASNDVATLGPFMAGGDFTLNNGGNPLQFVGAFSGAGHTLTVNGGAITQTPAGTITAGELTGSAAGVNLNTATNDIATLGPFTPGGDFTLNNGAHPLEFVGAFAGAGDTLTLTAGTITQTPTGAITAGELAGTAAGVDLNTATNDIATLGPFVPGGDFALNNGANPLQFVGAFSGVGYTLTLNAGLITQAPAGVVTTQELTGSAAGVDLSKANNDIAMLGPLVLGGDFTLNNGANPLEFVGAFSGAGHTLTLTAGTITQTPAGAITAGELTGTAVGVDLSTAANDIATLGPFAPGGNFTLNNGANPLEFVGAFSGTGDTLTLTAGAITQTPAGAITAGELTGSAAGVI